MSSPAARRHRKKTAALLEPDQELTRLVARIRATESVDLEAWETALRAAECGERMQSRGLRNKPLVTLLGPVAFNRYLGDEILDVVGTSRSPDVRQSMAR